MGEGAQRRVTILQRSVTRGHRTDPATAARHMGKMDGMGWLAVMNQLTTKAGWARWVAACGLHVPKLILVSAPAAVYLGRGAAPAKPQRAGARGLQWQGQLPTAARETEEANLDGIETGARPTARPLTTESSSPTGE